jgi:hypothetical protein
LGTDAARILSDPASELALPAIALAEACWIAEHGRVAIDVTAVVRAVYDDPRIEIHPLDATVVERSLQLQAVGEMHDRQILATALVLRDKGHEPKILTRDASIVAAAMVPVVW